MARRRRRGGSLLDWEELEKESWRLLLGFRGPASSLLGMPVAEVSVIAGSSSVTSVSVAAPTSFDASCRRRKSSLREGLVGIGARERDNGRQFRSMNTGSCMQTPLIPYL
jgi:hypothetical protein